MVWDMDSGSSTEVILFFDYLQMKIKQKYTICNNDGVMIYLRWKFEFFCRLSDQKTQMSVIKSYTTSFIYFYKQWTHVWSYFNDFGSNIPSGRQVLKKCFSS